MTNCDPSSASNPGSHAQHNPDHSSVGENVAGQATNVKAPDFIPQGKVTDNDHPTSERDEQHAPTDPTT